MSVLNEETQAFFVLTLSFIKNEQAVGPVFRAETREAVEAFIAKHSNSEKTAWLENSPFKDYYSHPFDIKNNGFEPIIYVTLESWVEEAYKQIRDQWASQIISIPTNIDLIDTCPDALDD